MFIDMGKPGSSDRLKSGMSLVELLTVMLIGLILLSLVFLLYTSTSRSYIRQDAVIEQMLNLRAGLAWVSRDLRMSGSGFSLVGLNQQQRLLVYGKSSDGTQTRWFRYNSSEPYGVKAIWGVDSDSGPDSVTTAWVSPEFSTAIGVLGQPLAGGSTILNMSSTLNPPGGAQGPDILSKGDILVVSNGNKAMMVESDLTVSNISNWPPSGNNIPIQKLPSLPTGISEMPPGSLIYNVKSINVITYRLDAVNHTLLADNLDTMWNGADEDHPVGDVVAENIEDFQVAYCQKNSCNPTNISQYLGVTGSVDFDTIIASEPIRTVRISIVSRSPVSDPYKGRYSAINSLNHIATAGTDSYYRRKLETTVQLRNF